jgi:hypothetical protein
MRDIRKYENLEKWVIRCHRFDYPIVTKVKDSDCLYKIKEYGSKYTIFISWNGGLFIDVL